MASVQGAYPQICTALQRLSWSRRGTFHKGRRGRDAASRPALCTAEFEASRYPLSAKTRPHRSGFLCVLLRLCRGYRKTPHQRRARRAAAGEMTQHAAQSVTWRARAGMGPQSGGPRATCDGLDSVGAESCPQPARGRNIPLPKSGRHSRYLDHNIASQRPSLPVFGCVLLHVVPGISSRLRDIDHGSTGDKKHLSVPPLGCLAERRLESSSKTRQVHRTLMRLLLCCRITSRFNAAKFARVTFNNLRPEFSC